MFAARRTTKFMRQRIESDRDGVSRCFRIQRERERENAECFERERFTLLSATFEHSFRFPMRTLFTFAAVLRALMKIAPSGRCLEPAMCCKRSFDDMIIVVERGVSCASFMDRRNCPARPWIAVKCDCRSNEILSKNHFPVGATFDFMFTTLIAHKIGIEFHLVFLGALGKHCDAAFSGQSSERTLGPEPTALRNEVPGASSHCCAVYCANVADCHPPTRTSRRSEEAIISKSIFHILAIKRGGRSVES